jgi:formate dehydrogenase (coenzyme F420) beta subunit
MYKQYKLAIENNDPIGQLNAFFKKLLDEKIVDALLLPQDAPNKTSMIQTLVESSEQIHGANPFAPLLLTNSAKIVSKLTFQKTKRKTAAVMRSCEIRACIELAKLKQINMEGLVIIGIDCMGTYESKAYQELIKDFKNNKALTISFLSRPDEDKLRGACLACEYPNPDNADIMINFFGSDINKEIFIQVCEKVNLANPQKLGLVACTDVTKWQQASNTIKEKRINFRDNLFKKVLSETKDIKALMKELEHCRLCYNCRRECPICYCRECIFDTLIFEHDSGQYFQWAQRKGKIRMPTDTLLFHLTRMNHMVISCVACGQCTSACPNGIHVAKLFKTIGYKVQQLFGYQPGKDLKEEIPQSTFKEDEFQEMGV